MDESNPYADGKWRMFLFDTESGQGLYGSQSKSANADSFRRIAQNSTDDFCKAFTKLLADKDFAEDFARTYMDIANYNFDTEKTTAAIDKYMTTYKQQILDSYERFFSRQQSGANGEQKLQSEYSTVSNFYKTRFTTAESTMRNYLSLSNQLSTVSVQNDISGGTLNFNTLSLKESNWSGKYHSDYDINVTAVPYEGNSFDHWEITGAELTSGSTTSPSISFKATGDVSIKAVYGKAAPGDYNGDGNVTVADLTLLSEFVLGKDVDIHNADIIADGVADTFDLAALRKMLIS